MFYRRKVILALLQAFEGRIEKIRLQKLLFLFGQNQQNPEYDFIPYKYGCFSYSANADIMTMVKKGLMEEDPSSYIKSGAVDYIKQLKEPDKKVLMQVKASYGTMSSSALMKHTYINFPYYAINSIKAADILSVPELEKIHRSKPAKEIVTLFTIGYEGISLEEYLNRLIKNDVKVLIDVRRNPLSMKFGFSKAQLAKYCDSIGVKYVHEPEVGIDSEQRQELNTQSDYDKLFEAYRTTSLVKTTAAQQKILDLLVTYKRVALTCFEANICQCHRKPLAESIAKLPNFQYQLKHI